MPNAAAHHSRHWDAIILGSALPGLVAGCKLAEAGRRVLLVEEAVTEAAFPGLFEPFLLPGIGKDGILHNCLQELHFPLIDRQQIEPEAIALQLILPHARIDLGQPATTDRELVRWGYTDEQTACALGSALVRAGRAEREAMRNSPFVRTGRFPSGRGSGHGTNPATNYARGLPAEYLEAPPRLRALLEYAARATSNLDSQLPPPEARARLLGAVYEGTGAFTRPAHSLRALFRKRFRTLHGELKVLGKGFELIEIDRLPGIAPRERRECWMGRSLILNTPIEGLANLLAQEGQAVPPMLADPVPTKSRLRLHWRIPKKALPEAMATHLIILTQDPEEHPDEGLTGPPLFRLQVFPSPSGHETAEIVASSAGGSPLAESTIEESVARLLPFSETRLEKQPIPKPLWDEPDTLSDPPRGAGWPTTTRLRLSSRPSVYHLPGNSVAALGIEGDLLLGMRAGEAIAAEID